MAEDTAKTTADEQIPTNLRLLRLLEEVAKAGTPVTPSGVNDTLGLPKPTLHRLFHTAEQEGFLQRDLDGRSYSPGRRLRHLAVDTLSSERVRTVRIAVLRSIVDAVGETCNIAIADRDGMYYLDRIESAWPLRIAMPVGTIVPFHCTASGKMYLSSLRPDYLDRYLRNAPLEAHTPNSMTDPVALKASMAQIRSDGYSVDDEEYMEGMCAIAVPIKSAQGRLLCTLSIHAPTQRQSVQDLLHHLDRLIDGAAELASVVSEA